MEPQSTIRHVVLAGDSIFDNDGYVPGEPGVITQLRQTIPGTWSATKVAVDGDCIRHVEAQINDLPTNTTDIVVSVGGNDARSHTNLLSQVASPADLEALLASPLSDFRRSYQTMILLLKETGLRVHVCTIYTQIPFDDPVWRAYVPLAVERFNQVIREEAASCGVPIVDIDKVCVEPSDFSVISPIEPSSEGGQKIVDLIVDRLS